MMGSFYWGLFVGVIIGLNIGVLVIGLLSGAKCGECGARIERWLAEKTG